MRGTRFAGVSPLLGRFGTFWSMGFAEAEEKSKRMWRLGQRLVSASHLFSNVELGVCSFGTG